MIAGCYTLDLYCDTPDCPTNYKHGAYNPVEFTDELGSVCRRRARKAGWKLGSDGSCLCPKCNGRKPEPRSEPKGGLAKFASRIDGSSRLR